MVNAKLVIADDDSGTRTFIRNVAEELGYEVSEVRDGQEFIDLYRDLPVDLILLDILMPEKHGVELFEFIHTHQPNAKVAIITGFSKSALVAAVKLGADKGVNMVGGLNKPIVLDDLESLLKGALT